LSFQKILANLHE